MADQDHEAPPEVGEDAPPDAGNESTDSEHDAGIDSSEAVDAASEDGPSLDGPDTSAADVVLEPDGGSPPAGDTPDTAEPADTDETATLDALTPPAERPPEEPAASELDAVAAASEAADVVSLDSAAATPATEVAPAEEHRSVPVAPDREPAAPAGPAPGHLGALRSATPPAVGRWLRREARPRPPVPSRYTTEAPEWIQPEFGQQTVETPSPPLGRSPGRLPAVVLAVLMSGVFLLFVLIEPTPTWLLLFGAIIAALGTDGVLRSIRHRIFEREDGPDTVPHLFLPALFALAVPLFIEDNLESYWVIPAALVAGVSFVLVILAEVPAEDAEDDEFRGRARFVSVAGTYFVGFALFSLTYTFDLSLTDGLIVIALVSVLLAVELLREGEVDPLETLLLSGVVGVVVAEARWVLEYMPIDAYPAGLTLVLVFYFVTGMVHAYMTRHINITVATEYSIVTALGLALVIAARATGIA